MFANIANPSHLLIIAVVLVVLFGAKKLPELGRGLGSGMREFKNGIAGKEPAETLAVAPVEAAPEKRA